MSLKEKIWSDFDSGLRIDNKGNVVVKEGDECLRQSIFNILSTMKLSRPRSNFGSGLASLLFEPINEETAEDIRDTIEAAVERHDNRITNVTARVTPYEDENYYQVVIRFKEKTSLTYQEILTFLEGRGN